MNSAKTIIGSLLVLLLTLTTATAADNALAVYRSSAQQIADGFTQRDTSAFDQAVAPATILDEVFSGLFVDSDWENSFRAGVSSAIRNKLGPRLVSQMPSEAYAKLLRVTVEDNEGRALIRMDYGDSGNGYIDLHLVRDESGAVRVIDWFDYSSGQRYTQSLRQVVATMSPTPTILGKVFDIATDKKAGADALEKIITLNKERRYEEEVRYFLSLEEGIRESRLLNIIVLQAANMSNDMELYSRMLDNLAHFYGDDERMAFMLIDYYFLSSQYDKVIELSQQLQKSFGVEDAGLIVFESNALLEQGKNAEAEKTALRAIELEPEYEYSYWSLLTAQLATESYASAVDTAKTLEEEFQYDMSPESLGSNDIYSELVSTKPYLSWRESLQ